MTTPELVKAEVHTVHASDAAPEDDLRVLVLPMTRRDGEATLALLDGAGVDCHLCEKLEDMVTGVRGPIGALIMTDAVLAMAERPALIQALGEQAAWSDIPVIVLVSELRNSPTAARALAELGNVTVLDRPVSVRSMTSAVLSALRDRRKQYKIRDQMSQQALAEQNLKTADRRKDEFLATLAHELRNPLAPIRAGLQVLARLPGETERAAEIRRMMERQMRMMVKLIDDLLDVSRISTGKVVLQREVIDLRDVVGAAIEATKPFVESASHTMRTELPPAPVWVTGDALRLTQVVSNLLNNAAKYTPDGGKIALTLQARDGQALVAVEDNGAGLPVDRLEEVFEMFSQVNHTLARSQGGLGIGLSLVRRLMELHDGTASARSDGPGCGSTFTLQLPTLAELPEQAPAPPAHTGHAAEQGVARASARVLVIDDNVDAADMLATLVRSHGHAVRTEHSAAAGLAALHEFHPSLVLCDLGMPGTDGFEVARRIRAEPGLAPAMLVAVTGWGSDEDRRRSMAAGFDRHLTKPISDEAFADLFGA